MTVYGVDLSHWQGDFDHALAFSQGVRFMYAKATEGQSYQDEKWPRNRDNAHAAGLKIAAYHFLRSDSAVEDQAANLASYLGGNAIPVVIDCEKRDSGGVTVSQPTLDHVRGLMAACGELGVKVTLLYLPRWYWSGFLGSPPLTDLPPIVQSDYGSNPTGTPQDIYPGDSSSRWASWGGQTPLLLQYGSRATVAGQSPVDVDAYRGTLKSLSAYFLDPEEHMSSPIGTASFNKPAYAPGETMVLTVDRTDPDNKAVTATVTLRDSAGNVVGTTAATAVVDPVSVTVSDTDSRAYTLASDDGKIAVFRAVA